MAKFKRSSPILNTPIVIDGETYNLRYDFTAFRQAEVELTKFWGTRTTIPGILGSIFVNEETTQVLSNKISVNDLCILLWCGLLHEFPKLKVEEIADFLDLSDLSTVMPVVIEAIGNSLTKAEPNKGETVQGDNPNVTTLQQPM